MSISNFKYKSSEDDTLEFKWVSEIANMACAFQLEKLTIGDTPGQVGINYNLLGHTKNFDPNIFEPQLQELIIALYSDPQEEVTE